MLSLLSLQKSLIAFFLVCRLNKESKYSSLLRSKKEQEKNEMGEPPCPPFPYRPLEAPPDPKMMVPRIPGGSRPFDPRVMDPMNYANSRPTFGPRSNGDSAPLGPRTPPKLSEPSPVDPRSVNGRTLDSRVQESRAIYARPIEANRPPRTDSNSSEESEVEPYGRIRPRKEWAPPPKRDASLDRRPERLMKGDQRPHHSELDLRMKPLQDLNGREKHVERFLASLEGNNR